MNKFSVAELNDFLLTLFPQAENIGTVTSLAEGSAEFKLKVNDGHLRPGGTVSGPTMMALADVAMYGAILNAIGPVALAVTTNLNINFLRKPDANCDIIALAKILKLGKRLAVGEVSIYSAKNNDSGTNLVAHATITYSIPNHE
ncbi:MAG: phenylacetic acid degradation protein [Hyphomicrobiales bacterium]|nr:MAG: phenylacetic acid degradation protein [Hyphomicrobiales bacterium]